MTPQTSTPTPVPEPEQAGQPPPAAGDFRPIAHDLDHPEGVAWGRDGYLYAGGEAGQIYRIDPAGGTVEQVASTGGFILGLALDAQSNVYTCDMGLGKVMRVTPGGTVAAYADGSPGGTMRVPNYPVFDAGGALYVSDSGSWEAEDGLIWRVLPGGDGQVFTRGVHRFPNGMALNAAGDWLYAVESTRPGVARVGLGPDGKAGPVEVVVELPHTVPDGLAFDAAGNLYISCYQPNRIYRLTLAGQLEVIADDWTGQMLAMPTNIAFFGSALDRLTAASLGGRTLRAAALGVRGLPLRYPDLRSGSSA